MLGYSGYNKAFVRVFIVQKHVTDKIVSDIKGPWA